MLIGYARVSKSDGTQSLDLQRDALRVAGVNDEQIYSDRASGKKDERPGLESCLKALRDGDVVPGAAAALPILRIVASQAWTVTGLFMGFDDELFVQQAKN